MGGNETDYCDERRVRPSLVTNFCLAGNFSRTFQSLLSRTGLSKGKGKRNRNKRRRERSEGNNHGFIVPGLLAHHRLIGGNESRAKLPNQVSSVLQTKLPMVIIERYQVSCQLMQGPVSDAG